MPRRRILTRTTRIPPALPSNDLNALRLADLRVSTLKKALAAEREALALGIEIEKRRRSLIIDARHAARKKKLGN